MKNSNIEKQDSPSNTKESASSLDEARVLFDSGIKHRALRHHDESLVYFTRSLKILLDNNQVADALTGELINMIGDDYDSIADAQPENLQYRLDSLAVMRAIMPKLHPNSAAQIARMLNNIGSGYLALNNKVEALKYFNQAIATLKEGFPFGGHPYNTTITNNILNICGPICDAGSSFFAMEKYDDALECLLLVAHSMQEAFPQGHKLIEVSQSAIIKIAVKLHQLGTELLKEKKSEEALKIFVRISDVMLRGLAPPASSALLIT